MPTDHFRGCVGVFWEIMPPCRPPTGSKFRNVQVLLTFLMCVNLQHFVTERVNLHLNSLACVCHAPVSEERSSGSRSCGLASLTPPLSPLFLSVCKVRKSDRCIAACITVLCHEQGGRGRLLVRATRVFRPKESAVDRVFSRACVFSLVLRD